MANFIYPVYGFDSGSAAYSLLSGAIAIALVNGSYTPAGTHEDVADIASFILARSANLTTKSLTALGLGYFSSDPAQFAGGGITSGTGQRAILYYNTPAADADRRLIACYDTKAGPTTPLGFVLTAGQDFQLSHDATTGWAKLHNFT